MKMLRGAMVITIQAIKDMIKNLLGNNYIALVNER
jgi:predicted transcriptional regulator